MVETRGERESRNGDLYDWDIVEFDTSFLGQDQPDHVTTFFALLRIAQNQAPPPQFIMYLRAER